MERLRALHERWVGQRGRGILQTSGWSLVAKACAAANLFITVPFVLHALGPVEFGVWATLVALVAFAGFLDFGFGNGAMNLIAAAHGRDDRAEVATVLRESWRALVRIALWLGLAVVVVVPLVSWHRLLGLPTTDAGQARAAVAVVLVSIVLSVPLNLANRVQLALGRGEHAFRWQAAGQLAALMAVVLLARAQASLAELTAAATATPLLAALANTLGVWHNRSLTTTPALRPIEDAVVQRRIRNEGWLFFGLQLTAALSFSADLPLVAALRGPAEAGTYAIVQRLFSAVPMVLSLVWAPLWPVYRQALAAGDHAWVRRTLRRSIAAAVTFAALAGAVLALSFEAATALWVQRPLVVGGVLLAGFATWCVVEAGGTALATFLNAASVLRYQLATACVFALICVGGKAWVLVRTGIDPMPWVTVVTYCLASVLPFCIFGRRIFAEVFARRY